MANGEATGEALFWNWGPSPMESDFSSLPCVTCVFPQFSRPEFALLAGEAPVTLHLPGSIVVTAGLDRARLEDGEGSGQLASWGLRLGGSPGLTLTSRHLPVLAKSQSCFMSLFHHPSFPLQGVTSGEVLLLLPD